MVLGAVAVAAVLASAGLADAGPSLTVETKLTPADLAAGDEFGNAVAMDGDTAVVGAVDQGCLAGAICGAAYVFVRTGSNWALQQKLTASDAAAGDAFGAAVAVSGDTIAVGAPDRQSCAAGARCGAVYVFTRSGTTWSEQQTVTAADAEETDQMGAAVALDGDTLVAGAPVKACASGIGCGAAYVFVRSGSAWSEQQKLTAADGARFDQFGHAVGVSGSTAVVGAPNRACAAGIVCGAAYVFVRGGSAWSLEQILVAPDAAAVDLLGISVAVDGDTVVAGVPLRACAAGAQCGAVSVFTRTGTVWSQQQVLTASDGAAGDNLGSSVALAGETALAGAPARACLAGVRCGAAYLFGRTGTTWSQQQKLTASDAGSGDAFGVSVAVGVGVAAAGALAKACPAGAACGRAYAFDAGGSQAPVAKCKDVIADTTPGACTASLSAEDVNDGSFDPDGEAITLDLSPAGPYPPGETQVVLTATDTGGASATCQAKITVRDAEAPVIGPASASPSVLWPPNHRMVDVGISYRATDNCGVAVCSLAVVSDEPLNGRWDGNTPVDWQVVDGAHVRLRAERSGAGDGRVYTVTAVCRDGSGNAASQAVNVTVPRPLFWKPVRPAPSPAAGQ